MIITKDEIDRRISCWSKGYWETPDNLDTTNFDFSWRPSMYDRPYIHQFGTQWQKTGGPRFVIPENEGIKYQDCQIATRLPNSDDRCWRPLLPNCTIDFSWHPDDTEPPFIYVFGNQWYNDVDNFMPTYQYRVKGATDKKYIFDVQSTLLPNKDNWIIPDDIEDDFDYSWVPNPYEPLMKWEFGTQWQSTGGPIYSPDGATETKYCDTLRAKKKSNENSRYWRPLVSNIKFDYSWHPDSRDPPYIYVFGNQWYDSITMPTVSYRTKGATETKFIDDVKAVLLPTKDKWEIPDDIDDSKFDYSWCPDPNEQLYIYQFGTQWQKTDGPRYVMLGATEIKYVDIMCVKKLPNMRNWRMLDEIEMDSFDLSWHPDDTEPPMMYEFGTQWQDAGGPIYVVKGSTNKKYCSEQRAIRKATLNRNWRPLVPNLEFDYSWHPDPNDPPYNYIFGNQWYSSEVMPTIMYRVKEATETKYINDIKASLTPNLENWITPDDIDDTVFDYSWCPDPGSPPYVYQFGTQWQKTGGPVYVVKNATKKKYIDVIKSVKKPNLRNWRIIESIVDGSFDYSWHPDETEGHYTYVFGNKFHIPEIMPTLMYKDKLATETKYASTLTADLEIQKIVYDDSIFDACKDHKFSTAYVHFVKGSSNYTHDLIKNDNVSVHLFPSEAIVPRDAVQYMYDKLSDYDYVVEHKFDETVELLDIIFISNGETCADSNYEHLLSLNLPNRITRIDRVNGRVASQHAAANASNTPWYFLVNAKLKVNANFDFNWQPNIHKSRRHYIFTATNSVNGLEYGHQAIVANNKKLTLNTMIHGLDFTMSSRTEVVEMNSGTSIYNTSVWDTWRTAFREAIKLSYNKDEHSKNRLAIWTSVGNGENAKRSIQGALDGVEYFNSVNGSLEQLMLTYDWDWIREYYNKLYPQ